MTQDPSDGASGPFDFAIDGWVFPHQLASHLRLAQAGRPWVYLQASLRQGPDNGGAAGHAIWEAIGVTDRSIVWASQHYANEAGESHSELLGGMRSYPLASVKTFNARNAGGIDDGEAGQNVPIDLYVASEVVPVTVGLDYVPGAQTVILLGDVAAVLAAAVDSWGRGGV